MWRVQDVEGSGGLVFKAHRLLYHSTLGLRVIQKKKEPCSNGNPSPSVACAKKLHFSSRPFKRFLVETKRI